MNRRRAIFPLSTLMASNSSRRRGGRVIDIAITGRGIDFAHAPRMRASIAVSLAFAASLTSAACGTGQQLAAGPTLGYVAGRGWSAGWEAGGGPWTAPSDGDDPGPTVTSLVSHVSVGMSWRPVAPWSAEHERLTYAAWEPWFLVGGTAGVAHSSADGNLHPLLGMWEAIPFVAGGFERHAPLVKCSPCLTASLAFGWRWGGGGYGELYLSPKLGILNDVTRPFPFQTFAD
jgi:hypothetical protein